MVENSIFHGIGPSEGCGVIRLWAEEEEDDLLLMVEDNGVGMTEEELGRLMKAAENPHPGGMASIGVANVNNRLKLTYGAQYGLSYQSEVGQFTRVTIRIPKEE